MFHKYPHIDNLYKVPEIFACEEVVATEKIHGSNFRVYIPADGSGVKFGSRNREIGLGSGRFDVAIKWFLDSIGSLVFMCQTLKADVIIFGEIYGTGIQTGVKYVHGNDIQFRAFDVMVGGELLNYDDFAGFCYDTFLPSAPLVYRGRPTVEALNALLEVNSIVAGLNDVTDEVNISEGVVIRPTKMVKDYLGNYVMAKHKSKGFAESCGSAHASARIAAIGPNPAIAIAQEYVTRGRLLNAVGRLLDAGIDMANDMSDMKKLPAEVLRDVLSDIREEHPHLDAKVLGSAVTRQTAIIYKALLNEGIGIACTPSFSG